MKLKLLLGMVPAILLLAACGAGTTSGGVAGRAAPPKPGGGASFSGAAAQGLAPAKSAQSGSSSITPPLPSAQHLELAATVRIQMAHDKFGDGLDTILGIIAAKGGYLASSSTQSSSDGTPRSGSFTFQVPVDSYQDTLAQLRGVGKYLGQDTSSRPHDAEYVDLQSRLKSAQLQLAAFNTLLSRATSIGDIINIEQQVGQVQQQIEQYQGQLKYLDSLTQYSTITVNLSEKGAVPGPRPVADQWGFASSFQQALHNLAAIANGFIVVTGTLLPFLLLGAAAFVTRRLWLPALSRT